MSAPTLGLAVPLYNEEVACEAVALGLIEALRAARIPFRLALVNNGSSDQTPDLIQRLAATKAGLLAVHLSENAGYGGGVLTGMRALDTPVLGWCWGDGQIEPGVVVACYRKLVDERLALVKARRVERRDGLQRLIVTRAYNGLMQMAFQAGTDDVNGCPKLLTRAAWEAISPQSRDWFLDPEVLLRARELGLSVGEVDAVMLPRVGGASKVRGETAAEFARHLWAWRGGWRP